MSLTIFIIALKAIVFFIITNVWLFRKNRLTPYRGGSAKTLKEEFSTYSLPSWSFYLIGFIKILCSVFILLSIWFKELEMISLMTLALIMCGSLAMHVKIKDPIKKSLPALLMLTILVSLMSMV